MKLTLQLLDYLSMQEEAIITYVSSEMILTAHNDMSYLSEPKACSHAGSQFFLSSYADIPPNNGTILNISHIIKFDMSSITEAKLAALFIAAGESIYIRIILEEWTQTACHNNKNKQQDWLKPSLLGKSNLNEPKQ